MVDLPQMCGSILLKNVKKNPKDITLHNASIVQKSLIVDNHKNFYHIWQTIALVVLMKLEENV